MKECGIFFGGGVKTYFDLSYIFSEGVAPCGLRGCKNRPAPFPGRMSYKATKPGSVCQPRFFLSVSVVLLSIGPLFALLFCVICVFCLLVVLVRLSVPVQVID